MQLLLHAPALNRLLEPMADQTSAVKTWHAKRCTQVRAMAVTGGSWPSPATGLVCTPLKAWHVSWRPGT